jgi:tRNA 2-thiouridine synthesizing protein A
MAAVSIPPPERLDVRGTLCPLPVLLAARRLDRLAAGARLTLVGDDPGILEDLPAWCADTGHRLVEIGRDAEGTVRAVVEKVGEEAG